MSLYLAENVAISTMTSLQFSYLATNVLATNDVNYVITTSSVAAQFDAT